MENEFDVGFLGRGIELFEHWEGDSLLLISSTTYGMELKPGDTIIRRRWAAAGEPKIYNSAKA